MNERKNLKYIYIYIAAALLLCVGAVFAYKAYGVYNVVRTQLDIIEENTRNNGYGNDNVLTNIYNLQSKAGADVELYGFDYSWLEGKNFISHAFGEIEGAAMTNSLDALENAYAAGLRVFEADMQLVDGKVLIMHDYDTFCNQSGLRADELDYESCMAAKLFGKYTVMDIDMLVSFLSEHPDAYLVTDSKYTSNPGSAYVIAALAIAAQDCDESVLDRVIIQIYNQQMLSTVMDIYPFKSVIYTLYSSKDSNEEAINFCIRTGIGAITAHHSRMTEDFCAKLNAVGIKPLVNTVNDPQEISRFFNMGVAAIYTDNTEPELLKR